MTMDRIFGVGGAEALFVLLIALLVLGPLRMARAAYTLGRWMRRLSLYSKELLAGLRQELDALDDAREAVQADAGAAPCERGRPRGADAASEPGGAADRDSATAAGRVEPVHSPTCRDANRCDSPRNP